MCSEEVTGRQDNPEQEDATIPGARRTGHGVSSKPRSQRPERARTRDSLRPRRSMSNAQGTARRRSTLASLFRAAPPRPNPEEARGQGSREMQLCTEIQRSSRRGGAGAERQQPLSSQRPPCPHTLGIKYLKAFKSLAGGSGLGVGKPKVLSRAGWRPGQTGECASHPKGHLLLSAVSCSPVRNAGPRPPHCSSWFLRRQKFRFLYAEGWQYISFLCVCYQR